MSTPLRILVLEDVPADLELIEKELKKAGFAFRIEHVDSGEAFVEALRSFRPQLILADYNLPRYDGLSALREARERLPETPFIIVSGTIGEEAAVDTLKQGAADYVLKNRLYRLGPAVERALREANERRQRQRAEIALKETNRNLETLIASSPLAIIVVDAKIRVTLWNPEAEALFGWRSEEVVGKPLPTFPPEIEQEQRQAILDCEFEGKRRKGAETVRLRKDGSRVDVSLWTVPLFDAANNVTGVMGLFADIGERLQAEAQMRKLSTAVSQSSDWVLITDPEGMIDYANEAVVRMSGYRAEELVGRNARIFKSGRHDEAFFRRMWKKIKAGKVFRGIMINRAKDGTLFYIDETISPLTDAEGAIQHYVSTGKDITEQRSMEEQLHFLAYYDALTGLANRTLFIDRLDQSLSRTAFQKRLLVVMTIDIDRFKYINDTFGTNAGDEVLKRIGRRLSRLLRDGDTVARLGSDQFGLLLTDVAETTDIILLVEKILKELSRPMQAGGNEIVTTLSIGITVYPTDEDSADGLIRNADAALVMAKDHKGNSYQFYKPGLNIRASEFLLLERDLFNALQRREFVLHYQPYYDLDRRQCIGMEALIRWEHPELGQMSPGTFIPILEETGLIVQAGEWIVDEAARQVAAWRKQGRQVVPVSVNSSPVQFRKKDLVEMIDRTLTAHSLPADLLAVEITEGILLRDIDHTGVLITRLNELGVAIVIDDFGTGYSSLSYLAHFPVQTLKIDISFIRELGKDDRAASIVTAIISMAHNIGLATIAEGVETEKQLEMLRFYGCDMVQGFFFSRPLPAEEAVQALPKRPQDSDAKT